MELKKLLEQEALENLKRDSAACREVVQRDLVEVVRCKDCKHWNNACCGLGNGDCHVLARLTFERFFCSYGERRTDHE